MKPTSLVLGSIHKVEGIVTDVVDDIADQEERPVCCIQDRIIDDDDLLEAHLNGQVVEYQEQWYRQH